MQGGPATLCQQTLVTQKNGPGQGEPRSPATSFLSGAVTAPLDSGASNDDVPRLDASQGVIGLVSLVVEGLVMWQAVAEEEHQ